MTVVCLGEVLIDQVVAPTGERQNFPGGAPANVAVALARLGIQSSFIGNVGQDDHGQGLIKLLQQFGVNCEGVQTSYQPTRIVEVRCSSTGDRVFGGFVGGHTTDFADAHLAVTQLPVRLLESASALVTGTLGMAYPHTRAAMEQAATIVKANGGQLIVDVNWRPTFWPDPDLAQEILLPWVQQADWLKISVEDSLALFKTDDVAALAAQFPQAHILLTDGARGCHYAIANREGDIGHVPAFVVTPQETTGAGDAFLAGVVYQLHQQNWQLLAAAAIKKMLTFANAMGALTTLKPGAIAAQPTPVELLTFLEEQTHQCWTM
jgi:fructokinase